MAIVSVEQLNDLIMFNGFEQRFADPENCNYTFTRPSKALEGVPCTLELYVVNDMSKEPAEIHMTMFACQNETQNRGLLLDMTVTPDKIDKKFVDDYILGSELKLGVDGTDIFPNMNEHSR